MDEVQKKNKLIMYHGGAEIIKYPEIRIGKYTKDFYWGFYCTMLPEQAERWAMRNIRKSVVNIYNCTINDKLNIKRFEKMSDDWLDFIAMCRNGGSYALECLSYERSYNLR